jgi:hypothetical protein
VNEIEELNHPNWWSWENSDISVFIFISHRHAFRDVKRCFTISHSSNDRVFLLFGLASKEGKISLLRISTEIFEYFLAHENTTEMMRKEVEKQWQTRKICKYNYSCFPTVDYTFSSLFHSFVDSFRLHFLSFHTERQKYNF